MIATVRATERISYAHRLQNHPGKCRFLHGHNSDVTVKVVGEVDLDTGMVVDFSTIRKTVALYDHSTVLEGTDPLALLIAQVNPVVCLDFPPTAENIAREILVKICELGSFEFVSVSFPETDDSEALTVWEKQEPFLDEESTGLATLRFLALEREARR